MVLLSQLMRTAAITGRTDNLATWFAGRQGGRWAEQTVRAAIPTAAAHVPTETLRDLAELHERGVLSDAEFESLRARLVQ
jgi:putative oligomerization/nucleic acid binding protein